MRNRYLILEEVGTMNIVCQEIVQKFRVIPEKLFSQGYTPHTSFVVILYGSDRVYPGLEHVEAGNILIFDSTDGIRNDNALFIPCKDTTVECVCT